MRVEVRIKGDGDDGNHGGDKNLVKLTLEL